MAEIASAYVSILPSAKGFGRSLDSQVSGQTRTAGASIGRTFGKMFVLGAGVIAAAGIGNLLKGSIDEAREAQKVGAATEQIIKSTGGAANLTAKQIGNLSSSLSSKIGVDDEAIQAGANLLLTFKNVRNEVGKGADIFTRATKAGADLAASGFGSIESNAKTLGKALNDPVKGMTALTRAGVTFTQAQQDRIKGLVEEGDLLGAQRLLLAEVESQVGGVAEATATAGDKAGVAFGNLKEQIGTALLPVIDRLANLFATRIAPAISNFIAGLQSGEGAAGGIAEVIRDRVMPVLAAVTEFIIAKVVPAYRDYLTRVLDGARSAFNSIREAIKRNEPQLRQLFAALKQVAEFILSRVVPIIGTLVGLLVKALGRAIVMAIDKVSAMVDGFNALRGAFDTIRGRVETAINKFNAFRSAVGLAARKAREAIATWMGRALAPIQALIDKIQAAIDKFNDLKAAAGGGGYRTPNQKPPGQSGTGVNAAENAGKRVVDGLIVGVEYGRGALGRAVDKMTEAVKKKLETLRSQLESVKSDFDSLASTVAGAFTSNLFEAENASTFLSDLLGTKAQLQQLKAAFAKLLGWGLKPEFLSQLFQSGNGGLILDLAAGPKAQATQAAQTFGDVMSLSSSLGTSVADVKFGDKLDGIRQEIKELRKDQKDNADRTGRAVGREVSGASRRGHRRGLTAA